MQQKQTHRHRKQTCGYQVGEVGGRWGGGGGEVGDGGRGSSF